MVPLLRCLLAFLVLTVTVWADRDTPDVAARYGNLRRQDSVQSNGENTYDCLPSCELGRCGVATCGTRRRDTNLRTSWNHDTAQLNASESLIKRAWRIGSNNGNQLLTQHSDWTIDQVNSYVFNQVIHNWDNQYGGLRGLFSGHDESAVSDEDIFGSKPFQIGSNGLHGCQIVTVVSKRAVWMAHFWESYTNGKPNKDSLSPRFGITAFDERMTYFLTGRTVDPATADKGYYKDAYPSYKPTRDHPYLTPVGNPLDKASFNQPGDETKVFIMSPISGGDLVDPIYKYESRLRRVRTALVSYLGDDITVVFVPYQPIEDENEQDTSERGLALFQYDPNADGKHGKQWRLFYENRVFQGNIS